MRPEKIAFIFLGVVGLFFLWLFRKKVSYWFSPSSVISDAMKRMAYSVHFFSALIIACVMHGVLIHLFEIDNRIENYPEVRIGIILLEFVTAVILMGMLIDRYFNSTNPEFKEWKRKKYS